MFRVTYKPNRFNAVCAPFFAFISIGFLLLGLIYPNEDISTVVFSITIGIFAAVLTVILYKSGKTKIIMDENGMQIYTTKNNTYVAWEMLKFGYLSRDYKGNRCWVLSPEALNKKQAKWYANKGANTLRVYIEGVVVLFLDPIQNTSEMDGIIRKMIEIG